GCLTIDESVSLNFRTAPFNARFPNTNQTRNCFQNYFHSCNKALSAKEQHTAPCERHQRVYKSLCLMSWVQKWDDQLEARSFPQKDLMGRIAPSSMSTCSLCTEMSK
uniref:Cytochrome c oxidase subunit 6B1 n=1 Tax=Gasterosteus aculeatus aculeatus TaxID=481459 RepID=A0AAQ4Q4J4_GASAC